MACKAVLFSAVSCFFVALVLSNEVTDEINQVIDEVKAEIEQLKAKINADGNAVAGRISGELNAAYQSLDGKVEEAVKKAAAAGIDITACTKQLNSTATSDITTRSHNAVQCITKEMTDALGYAEQELSSVEEAEKDVQDGEAALKACDKLSTWKKVKCVAEETAKLVQEAKKIKGDMVTAKNKLEWIAANYTQDIKGCENGQLSGAESDAKKAGEDFVLCVVSKGVGL